VRCSRHWSTPRNWLVQDVAYVDEDISDREEQRSCISHRSRHIAALDADLYGSSTRNCQEPSLQCDKQTQLSLVWKHTSEENETRFMAIMKQMKQTRWHNQVRQARRDKPGETTQVSQHLINQKQFTHHPPSPLSLQLTCLPLINFLQFCSIYRSINLSKSKLLKSFSITSCQVSLCPPLSLTSFIS